MTQTITAPAPAAGWYPDPGSIFQQRYWDGMQWTAHVQPTGGPGGTPVLAAPSYASDGPAIYPGEYAGGLTAYQPEAVPEPVPGRRWRHRLFNAEADLAAGKNAPALYALVLGIISVIVNPWGLLSLGAIVWGVVGLRRAGTYAGLGYLPLGRTRAIWGLALGVVGLLLGLLVAILS